MTIYNVAIGVGPNEVIMQVEIPGTCQDTAFLTVSDENNHDLLGVELAHGEVVSGHWPDDDDWADVLHVPNPLGEFQHIGKVLPVAVRLISTPQSRNVERHPAQDDLLAVARAVGVTDD
ncbi:MAG: hypothetical protein ABIQ39_15670 [Ilumatobacteraceae bacterium]